MEHKAMNGVTSGRDKSSTTEPSSSESSLHDADDVPNNEAQVLLAQNKSKDEDEIHAELIYDLPSTASPELDISPINALHLHLPSSGDVQGVDPSTGPDGYLEHSMSGSPSRTSTQPTPRPSIHVRFRSRVRIASGTHHHHHSQSQSHLRRSSTGSVDSESSLCSSISAPLRYPSDDTDSRPSFRFSAILKSKGQRPRSRRPLTPVAPPLSPPRIRTRTNSFSGERAPLLRASGARRAARTRRLYGNLSPDGEDERSRRARPSPVRKNVDVFGPWPWRLFNGYWWAWKCGSISGCCCPADVDDDESEDEQEHGR